MPQQYPVEVFITTFADGQLGYDLQLTSEQASVADFLAALERFAAAHLADCRGCDGCCWERAPLTAPDIPALAALLPPSPYPAQAVCRAFAEISCDAHGIIDIILKRDADSACGFLDRAGKFCRAWQARPFVCQSHFCLPKSARLQALRQEIANRGENELARLLFAEEANGAPPLLAGRANPADFPADPAWADLQWQNILIKEIVTPELFAELQQKG